MSEVMANGAVAVFAILAVLWMSFWVIRLAVRYGVNDALRSHREIVRQERSRDRTQEPTG